MEVAEGLSTTYMPCNMWNSLIHGVRWLKRASEVVSAPCKFRRCKLTDVEEILARSQVIEFYSSELCCASSYLQKYTDII